ncbi:MAG: radical SAM family heme chaperone HemW [Flavobacteriales bacterium]
MSGIYIHIPFCRKKCAYCDFHFSTTFEGYRTAMVEQMLEELVCRLQTWKKPIETIYFGGGSPGLLTPFEIEAFLTKIHAHTSLVKTVEITLEANPEDLTKQNLNAWNRLGINRLSLGVQSVQDRLLQWMNRNHNANDIFTGLERLSHYPFSLSMDVIFGIPNQNVSDLEPLIALVKANRIDHVSAYALTKEPKTLLDHWIKTGKHKPVDDEEQIVQYEYLREQLLTLGFEQYEVSNYARNKAYAKHNSNYWKRKPYLGVGPGAHSFDGLNERRWNVSNNARYLKQTSWYELETLDAIDQWNERWLTGLRTQYGVSFQELNALGGLTTGETKTINSLIQSNKMMLNEKGYSLPKDAFIEADRISAMLFRLHD